MTGFLLASALLALVAAAFVFVPLLRRATHGAADRRNANVALYREREAMLDAELAAGEIDAAEHEAMRAESAASLLDDAESLLAPDGARNDSGAVPGGPGNAATAGTARLAGRGKPLRFAVAVAVATVLVAVAVYRELGSIALVSLDADRELLAADGESAPLASWAERLERHLARNPDDAKSWYLLGHARLRQRDYGAAASAFEAVARLTEDDVTVLSSLAQARYLADDGTVTPPNRALMARVLALEPNEAVVREILAMDAMRSERYEEAVTHLERALAGDVGGARADALRSALDRARELGGIAQPPPAAGIDVAISVDAEAGGLGGDAAIFVFARRAGERMPLLVAKVAPMSPVTNTRLDAGNAMQPGTLPNDGEQLEIVARLAPSGKVGDPAAGRTSVASVVWGTDAAVALSLQEGQDADLPQPAAEPRAAAGIPLHVALDPALAWSRGARVFVIVREVGGMPMPVAVRPLDPSALPIDLVLTDADAMQPTRKISQFEVLEVLARLSRSGTAMRGEGDLESAAVQVRVGDAVPAQLLIGSAR